ncbi:MAG: hypothetical protein B6244_13690 [Candidatus Cloacimonetes bacterium 4572_55]|nr:MAG: hypothetical protein B6244_13690 [Candidatus Cloacimonetes bacterium 4572_55]
MNKRKSRRSRSRKPKSGESKQQPNPSPEKAVKEKIAKDREKRFNTLENFLGNDEIQRLPSSLKVSKLADKRLKHKDQVVISTFFESKGVTYFFDVHDIDEKRNLTIMQSVATKKGTFERQKIVISKDDLPSFLDELRKVIGFFVV